MKEAFLENRESLPHCTISVSSHNPGFIFSERRKCNLNWAMSKMRRLFYLSHRTKPIPQPSITQPSTQSRRMMEEKAALSIMQNFWALQLPKSLMHEFCLYHACPSNLEENFKLDVDRRNRFETRNNQYSVIPLKAEKNEGEVLTQI